MNVIKTLNFWVFAAAILGVLSGMLHIPALNAAATDLANVFMNLFKLISLPLIFLSLTATITKMEDLQKARFLGAKVIKYTLLTTLIAAAVALGLFVLLQPATSSDVATYIVPTQSQSYLGYILKIIPENPIQPFVENNILGVLFLALVLSIAVLNLENKYRTNLSNLFNSLFQAVMRLAYYLTFIMPIAIWAFVCNFVYDLHGLSQLKTIGLYILCVVLANVIQATVVLPSLLKAKGVAPIALFKKMLPALSLAFFSRSTSVALPVTMRCMEEHVKQPEVSRFTLPICATINMNACAAFILITVLFVATNSGIAFTTLDLISWIFIATLGAVGNAAVPMGCYFVASAFLAAMGANLELLAVILPIYALIDMLESAINVWSDSTVAAVIDAQVAAAEVNKVDLKGAAVNVKPIEITS